MKEPRPGEVWESIGTGQQVTIVRIECDKQTVLNGIHVMTEDGQPAVIYREPDGREKQWRLHVSPEFKMSDPEVQRKVSPIFTREYRRIRTKKTTSAASL